LLSEAEHKSFRSYLINTDLYKFEPVPHKITNALTEKGINKGDTNTSDLNFILKTALDSTSKDDLSILITDGIYSVAGDQNSVIGKLKSESNFTARHFEDRLSKDKKLQTVLIKLNSRFNGSYYTVQGARINIDQQRPYYLWLFGSVGTIATIQKNLKFSDLPGYQHHIIFTSDSNKPIEYSILSAFMNKGTFRQHHDKIERPYHITNAEKDRRSKDFQFTIGLDLRNIPAEKSYLLNKANYEIIGKDDYTIASIHEVYTLSPEEIKKINNPNFSHVLVLHSSKNPYGSMHLVLKKQLPVWIKKTHSSDDTNIKGDTKTTLGFQHLVSSIDRAYSKVSKTHHYINLPLTIDN